MPDFTAGTVRVPVYPDMTKFSSTAGVSASKAGTSAGKSFVTAFSAAARSATDLDADTSSATAAGRTSASRFAAAFKATTGNLADLEADSSKATSAGRTTGARFASAFKASARDLGDVDADAGQATAAGRSAGTKFSSGFKLATPDLGDVDADVGQAALAGRTAGKAYGASFAKSSSTLSAAGGAAGGLAKSAAKSGLVGLAVAGAAAIGMSVKLEATFSKTMNQMAVVAKVPEKRMGSLRDLAIKLGRDTVFSANDAAEAMLELAKNGISPATIKAGALDSALTLAAAGGVEMSDAASIMGNTLNAFNLKGGKSASVAAALAGAANASSADISDLASGLQQASAVANDAGFSVQETTGALAAFANAGIAGSDAGTSLKTMMTRLIPSTDKAQMAMHDYGLKFTDANGEMVSMANVSQQLKDKLGGLSQEERSAALNTIFGSDARRGATVLMNEGADGINKYVKATSDQGAAERLAAASMKGTAGAWETMKGSAETVALQLGQKLAPAAQATFLALADGLNALPGIASKLGEAFAPMKPLFEGLWSVLKVVFKFWVIQAKVLVAVWAVEIKVLAKVFGWLWGVIKPVLSAIGTALAAVGRAMSWLWAKAIKPALNAIGKAFGWLWSKVIKPVFGWLGGIVKGWWNNVWKPVFSAVGRFITKVLGPAISGLWNKVVKPVFGWIGDKIATVWNKVIKPVLSKLWDFLKKDVGPAIQWLWNKVVKPTFQWIGDKISRVWNSVIKPVFGAIDRALHGDLAGAFRTLQDVAGRVWDNIVDGIQKVPGLLKDLGGKFLDAGKFLIQKLWDGLKKAGSFVGGIAKSIANGLIGFINDAIDGLNDLLEFTIHLTGAPDINVNPPNLDHLPEFARGGRVNGATPAMIGEGREAETVLPDSLLTKLVGAVAKAALGGKGGRGGSPAGGQSNVGVGIDASLATKGADEFKDAAKRVRNTITDLGKGFVRFNKGPLKDFGATWRERFRKDLPGDARDMGRDVQDVTRDVGRTFSDFKSGPVRDLEQRWRETMRRDLPGDARDMGRDVRDVARDTGGSLRDFGNVAKQDVAPAFKSGVKLIGAAWSKVQTAAKNPIRFVITTVLNKGLIGAFNKIAKFVDTDPMAAIKLPAGFAQGGVLPGYTPGRDVHQFSSPTGGKLNLSGGEAIMVPEWTRAVGGEKAVDYLNNQARRGVMDPVLPGHFAGGGVFRPVKGGSAGGIHDGYTGFPAVDIGISRRHAVAAIASGTVSRSEDIAGPLASDTYNGDGPYGSYGRVMQVQHPGGYESLYAHLDQRGFSRNTKVQGGQIIALSGSTGNSSGPHLHFGVRGRSPLDFMGASTNYSGSGSTLGNITGGGAPALPGWAQAIVDNSKAWATKLLDGGKKLSGPFGSITQDVLNKLIAPSADWATQQLGTVGGVDSVGMYHGNHAGLDRASPAVAKSYAKMLVLQKKIYGWGANQWPYWLELGNRESGWIYNNWNDAGSGAYGIPQALPATKMRAAGADYMTNAGTQIDWMAHYIKNDPDYGTPQKAIQWHNSHDWYDGGGEATGRGFLMKNVLAPERTLSPAQTVDFNRLVDWLTTGGGPRQHPVSHQSRWNTSSPNYDPTRPSDSFGPGGRGGGGPQRLSGTVALDLRNSEAYIEGVVTSVNANDRAYDGKRARQHRHS